MGKKRERTQCWAKRKKKRRGAPFGGVDIKGGKKGLAGQRVGVIGKQKRAKRLLGWVPSKKK